MPGPSASFAAHAFQPTGNAQIVQSSDNVSAAGVTETSQCLSIRGKSGGAHAQSLLVKDELPLPAPFSKETRNNVPLKAPAGLPPGATPNNTFGGVGLEMPQNLLSRSPSADRNLPSSEQTDGAPMPVNSPGGNSNKAESQASSALPLGAAPNSVSGGGDTEVPQTLSIGSTSSIDTLQSAPAVSVSPVPTNFSTENLSQYSQTASAMPPAAAPSEEVLIELEIPKGEDIPLVFANVLADDDFTPAEIAKNQSLADDFALKAATSGAEVNPVRWRREVNHADELFYTWYGQDAYYAMQARRQNEKTPQP